MVSGRSFQNSKMLREAAKQTMELAAAIPDHASPLFQAHTAGCFPNTVSKVTEWGGMEPFTVPARFIQ